jgi:hypothetical protein
MESLLFIALFMLIIFIVGLLANREIAEDGDRARERRREYARYRSVFGGADLHPDHGKKPEEQASPDQEEQDEKD